MSVEKDPIQRKVEALRAMGHDEAADDLCRAGSSRSSSGAVRELP